MKKICGNTVVMLLVIIVCTSATWADLTKTQVSQLYVGVFGRASEGGGNSYWQTDSHSTNMVSAANVMLNTEPAKDYFGSTLYDNHEFIEHIYLNTLGKTYAEDFVGVDYWVDELEGGKTKGEVIAALIVAAQHPANAGAAQDMFNNKVEVSNYCADMIAVYTKLETFTDFIKDVTDDASVALAKELINAQSSSSYVGLVRINTSMGSFDIRLAGDQAPLTVKNFMTYVDEGFYDGLVFHRVVTNFMIQGGGFDLSLIPKETRPPIDLEIAPFLLHTPGVIAMARTSDPNSATSQFFINVAVKPSLNNVYATFGQVETGYDIVENISRVATGTISGLADVPITPVQIISIYRVVE